MKWGGWVGVHAEPQSVSLALSYHKEYQYIWLGGGDLNKFGDIRPFMNRENEYVGVRI